MLFRSVELANVKYGDRVAVIGIGVSNRPLIRLLLERGIPVTACDKKSREALGPLGDELEQHGAYTGELLLRCKDGSPLWVAATVNTLNRQPFPKVGTTAEVIVLTDIGFTKRFEALQRQMLEDVAYQSNTQEFWNACVGICDERDWRMGGSFFDGKGQPSQVSVVSHGASTTRFNGINVINTARSLG